LGRSFKLFSKGVSDMVGRVASEFGEQAATDIAISSAKKDHFRNNEKLWSEHG